MTIDRIDLADPRLPGTHRAAEVPLPQKAERKGRKGKDDVGKSGAKRCKECGKSVAEGVEFGKHAAFKDGLSNRCKKCNRDRQRRNRDAPAKNVPTNDAPAPGPRLPVPCDLCPERFATAVLMGQHKTRVHFADSNITATMGRRA